MISKTKKILVLIQVIGCLCCCSSAFPQTNDSGQDDYLYARRLFDEGYFDLAAEQLERVLSDNPGMLNADEAQFLLGESLMLAGKIKDSRAAFLRVVILFPESPRAPEAMYNIGIALEKMEQFPEAVQAYRRVYSFYPQTSLTTESLRRALMISTKIEDRTEAELIGDLLIEKYPYSEAADQARLLKAKWQIELGNQLIARSYLERIAERSLLDSLASKAHLMLGRLFKENWEFDSADRAFRNAINSDSTCSSSNNARLELAELLNYRGLPDGALLVLQPLIKKQLGVFTQRAIMRAGDASYRKGNLVEAFQIYSKSNLPESNLKTAWVAERLGYSQKALDKYLELSSSDLAESKPAKLRAAQLASSLSQSLLAEKLWTEISENADLYDPFGQTLYELSKTKLTNLSEDSYEQLTTLIEKLHNEFPRSPYLDDVLYFKARAAENLGNYHDAKSACELLIKLYPASPLSDSAQVTIDFLNRCRLRGDKLMERMAELSSKPMTSKNQADWSLDWGWFYLNDFKDPVKAIDQYDIIIEKAGWSVDGNKFKLTPDGPKFDEVLTAMTNSCDAYLRLYQIGVREQDSVAIEMYRDSTHVRMKNLEKMMPIPDVKLHLRPLISATDLSIAVDREAILLELKNARETMIWLRKEQSESSFWISNCLRTITNHSLVDSAIISDWFDFSEIGLVSTKNVKEIAAIKWFQVQVLESPFYVDTLQYNIVFDGVLTPPYPLRSTAEEQAQEIFKNWRQTPGAYDAARWLIEHSSLEANDKLQQLEKIESDYYYLIEPETIYRAKSSIFDSLGRHLEALNYQMLADEYANWGRPQLDILAIPSSEERYYLARAYLKSDSLYLSALEYRILLNMDPDGEYTAPALMDMASILATQDLTEVAIQYIDTLSTNFPYSAAATMAEHIRPLLEFDLGRYSEAYQGFKSLRSQSLDQDSSYFYDTQMVICLYRQNLLELARKSAKELYRNYKDRVDLNGAKARFYLEKGKSLDRTKQFEEARKNYELIIKEYYLTQWVDDATYAMGLSYVTQNHFENGIKSLVRFSENYPESNLLPVVKFSLGMAYVRSEKYSEGISTLKQIWEGDGSSSLWIPVFKTLISLYRKMHFFDAGIKLTREYITRFPNAEDVFDRKMEIGQFYLQIGEWDEGVRHYRPLLQIADAEREAEIQYYIGEAYFNKGEFRTAILEFIKVPVLGRKTKLDWGVTALYQAAACYEKLGESEGAARMYRQIISETGETSNFGRAAQEKLDLIRFEDNED